MAAESAFRNAAFCEMRERRQHTDGTGKSWAQWKTRAARVVEAKDWPLHAETELLASLDTPPR
jgi:hypothetical protein